MGHPVILGRKTLATFPGGRPLHRDVAVVDVAVGDDVDQLPCFKAGNLGDHGQKRGVPYGYQLGVKHRYPQGEMDQVDKILWDLKHDPASRRILASMDAAPFLSDFVSF